MPTQEERLLAVEQVVAALRSDINDINRNETILLGLAMKHDELLREMRATFTNFIDDTKRRFEAHDKRFDAHDKRFDAHDKRFDRLEEMLSQVLARLPEKS